MYKSMMKLLAAGLVAAFVAGASLPVNAQEKERKMPFNGKIVSVDKSAKSLVIGKRTFHVTAQSEITKQGKAATLDDAQIGEMAGGSFVDKEGKLEIVKVRFGPKPEGEAVAGEKKEEKEAGSKKK